MSEMQLFIVYLNYLEHTYAKIIQYLSETFGNVLI